MPSVSLQRGGRICCDEESEVEGLCCVVILQDVIKRMQKDCQGLRFLKSQLCFPVLFRCSGVSRSECREVEGSVLL